MAQITVTIIAADAADLQDTLRRMASGPNVVLASVRGSAADDAVAAAAAERAKAPTSENTEVKATRKAKTPAASDKAEAPAAEPTTPEPTAETLAISTGEARVDPAQEALAAEEAEGTTTDAPETYDYNTVVMPLVLEVMGLVNDREFIMGKIREYGGENAVKASEIPDDRMAAFVADMRAVRDAKTAKS